MPVWRRLHLVCPHFDNFFAPVANAGMRPPTRDAYGPLKPQCLCSDFDLRITLRSDVPSAQWKLLASDWGSLVRAINQTAVRSGAGPPGQGSSTSATSSIGRAA